MIELSIQYNTVLWIQSVVAESKVQMKAYGKHPNLAESSTSMGPHYSVKNRSMNRRKIPAGDIDRGLFAYTPPGSSTDPSPCNPCG